MKCAMRFVVHLKMQMTNQVARSLAHIGPNDGITITPEIMPHNPNSPNTPDVNQIRKDLGIINSPLPKPVSAAKDIPKLSNGQPDLNAILAKVREQQD